MARTPYLTRRGNVFHFRIEVPFALRAAIGARELVRTLHTESRCHAEARALQCAAIAKSMFLLLRHSGMNVDMQELLKAAKDKLARAAQQQLHEDEIEEVHRLRVRQVRETFQAATIATLHDVIARHGASASAASNQAPREEVPLIVAPSKCVAPVIALKTAVESFLRDFSRKKPAMLKKHQAVLPLFLHVVGDKPVSELRQADLAKFFVLVCRLPPRWSDSCKRLKITPMKLAETDHEVALTAKTFKDTYRASISAFLVKAKLEWGDDGFPGRLTTDGIEYSGRRDESFAQRAFTSDELERLFHGPELTAARTSLESAHKFWLPALGFYTGARVNELCQLNPQVDIQIEVGTAIPYLHITPDSDGDERITKTVKKPKVSKRKVPIHPRLIELGFLEYVEAVRKAESKLLFGAWAPSGGRAATLAAKWFRTFLSEVKLRDDGSSSRLVGMHAFRSTFCARAENTLPPVDPDSIVGHASATRSAVARGYSGALELTNKLALLESINFRFIV